jgi:hypothetical protein
MNFCRNKPHMIKGPEIGLSLKKSPTYFCHLAGHLFRHLASCRKKKKKKIYIYIPNSKLTYGFDLLIQKSHTVSLSFELRRLASSIKKKNKKKKTLQMPTA